MLVMRYSSRASALIYVSLFLSQTSCQPGTS